MSSTDSSTAATAPSPADPPSDDQQPAAPFSLARLAAARIAELTGIPEHRVAVVLGSGWGEAVSLVGETVSTLKAQDVPGFHVSGIPGHAGTLSSVRIAGTDQYALVIGARTHLYESRDADGVAHGVRTAAAAGARTVVLTNGCGGLNPQWEPGTVVLLSDQLNLTGTSPLRGPAFVDLTDLYSARLRALARRVEPELPEGVYAQFAGPQYETPAEVRMAGRLGADLVGMSTALEAIAARHAGLEILGLSLVTNLGAGISAQPLSHDEVTAAGHAAAPRIGALLAGIVQRLAAEPDQVP